tara:strand:- start:319 stop:1347 length:1029 start_codon:yes stop_codon:yes gene_type:complete
MIKRFIFFRNDRLGDFIILTSVIKKIKDKFKDAHITILSSNLNNKFVRKYKLIDRCLVYKKESSIFDKLKVLNEVLKYNYFASFAVDGKSFSNLCNFFLKSNYKYGIVYKFKILNFWLTKPNFIYRFFLFSKYETFTSKKNLNTIEHLPTKLAKLGNFLGLNIKSSDNYFFDVTKKNDKFFKSFYNKKIKSKYVLIHLDEKWNDIQNVNSNLFKCLLLLQKKIKKKLVITSFNNTNDYFFSFKKSYNKHMHNKLLLIENANLFFFERLINYSIISISCHSGFLVQIAGTNKTNIIDIINKRDYKWYSCWKPKNTNHKFLFKSNFYKFFSVDDIFRKLALMIK